ncbi:bifunctional 4-hydroxy-2-oxoglutarate aldolase/2-dehydro-3-deoxy-phosphogluconate aldolase [Leptolyngbya sp. FACHB-16]|nr:bifunctional 4-hydroxy-2-oxoglutarate aldolase/2-dehydro-3-deoxy-phosphogluconate aldolase [Leptolyngbya sp. FACHB-8]MBD2153396.1 bifunctional 4-hydroxy-2-oxoglutarate aldolase/2-dehydro-3-deoxy-phosphogluconate aldolase [Leptolyngbya sp. FACHB-16]
MSIDWLSQLRQERAIAVIRSPEFALGFQMAQAVAAGGMGLIEITWNSDRPAHLIAHLRETLPHCTIGAGTLMTESQVEEAIAAGAQFLFTPHTNPRLIETADRAHVPMVPGTLTPTEIVTAWQAGASAVKVFPIQSVGGANYLRCLQGPIGQIPMIPTGGVTLENTRTFLEAGAIAVGLSGQLFPQQAIATGDWSQITDLAQTLRQRIHSFLIGANGHSPIHSGMDKA